MFYAKNVAAVENIEEVEQQIAKTQINPTQETNLAFGTIQVILKKDLHLFSYRSIYWE